MYGNALEALIGAIYLDQGYRMCYHFVEDVIINKYIDLDNIARKEVNFKSSLIEWSQKNKLEITFELIESFTDNDGNPVFQTGVTLADTQIGVGIGYSKKESQQNARLLRSVLPMHCHTYDYCENSVWLSRQPSCRVPVQRLRG